MSNSPRPERSLRLPLFPPKPPEAKAPPIPSAPGTIKGIDMRTGLTLGAVAAGLTALFLYDPMKSMNLVIKEPREPKLSKSELDHIDTMQQLLSPERYRQKKALEARRAGAAPTGPRYSPTRPVEVNDISDDITDDFEPVGSYDDDDEDGDED